MQLASVEVLWLLASYHECLSTSEPSLEVSKELTESVSLGSKFYITGISESSPEPSKELPDSEPGPILLLAHSQTAFTPGQNHIVSISHARIPTHSCVIKGPAHKRKYCKNSKFGRP